MRNLGLTALCFVLLGACAGKPTPADIVDTERAFAADGYERGVKASFLKYSADDAVMLQPGPVNVHEAFLKTPDPDPNAPHRHLVWWPLWAGVARSGDLGFTTGPYGIDDNRIGHYFTVWKKQADGSWKWVFDSGVDADPSSEAGPDAKVDYLPLATARAASPDSASMEVRNAEDELAAAASDDLVSAYIRYLATDAHIHTEGPPPAKSQGEYESALKARAAAMTFSPLGGGASKAGDLVWTYGEARWNADGADRQGYYVRVWQNRRDGWRIVFDELKPSPSDAKD